MRSRRTAFQVQLSKPSSSVEQAVCRASADLDLAPTVEAIKKRTAAEATALCNRSTAHHTVVLSFVQADKPFSWATRAASLAQSSWYAVDATLKT